MSGVLYRDCEDYHQHGYRIHSTLLGDVLVQREYSFPLTNTAHKGGAPLCSGRGCASTPDRNACASMGRACTFRIRSRPVWREHRKTYRPSAPDSRDTGTVSVVFSALPSPRYRF